MNRSLQQFLTVATVLGATAIFACGAATGVAGKPGSKDKEKDKTMPAAASGTVAALVGDRSISVQEVDIQAAGPLMKVRQDEYEARVQVLDGIINVEVLAREAKGREMTPEQLLESDVRSKVADPNQAAIDAFYEQNKARFGTQTKEQISPQITAMLRAQQVGALEAQFIKGLRAKHGVKVMIEPPRLDVALRDDEPAKGPKDAPITIVEYSDYECGFCSRAEGAVQQVLQKYGEKVRLVYRDFPLHFHKNAETASMGAACAREQGKFWEMHKAMFANQQKLASNDLVEAAGGIGIEKDKFKTCLDSGKYRVEVQKELAEGQKYGVTGTPTFFINGIMMVGARGPESFYEIIDRELERHN